LEDVGGKKGGDVISSAMVIIAMEAEALPSVEALHLAEDDQSSIFPKGAPWKKFSGEIDGLTIHIVVPGKDKTLGVDSVGTVPSSLLTYAAAVALQPDLIINAGTAGGFQAKGAAIGDVYIATEFANHDRRIPIPVFDEYGVGTMPAFPMDNLIKDLNLKHGKLSTGNSLDMTSQDEEHIKANDATVKDMEGAAVAYVADLLAIPVISLKAVTDIVDGTKPTVEEFLENMSLAASALSRTVPLVLKYVSGKTVAQLHC
jgi:5'-methylthioadenosine nucleosidase